MPLLFLAVLIGIPVLEIFVFVELGGEIGALNTIILTVLTAAVGMILLRIQGLSVLTSAQTTLNKGGAPVNEILNGILLAVAGLFLLIPGFVTDGIGFLLFLPPLRALVAAWLGSRINISGHPGHRPGSRSQGTTIIDGDFQVVENEPQKVKPAETLIEGDEKPNPDSPWSKSD
ncbi:MAG: FxsA family protein [Sneathiella sp.]